jgi:hypothetical protein
MNFNLSLNTNNIFSTTTNSNNPNPFGTLTFTSLNTSQPQPGVVSGGAQNPFATNIQTTPFGINSYSILQVPIKFFKKYKIPTHY